MRTNLETVTKMSHLRGYYIKRQQEEIRDLELDIRELHKEKKELAIQLVKAEEDFERVEEENRALSGNDEEARKKIVQLERDIHTLKSEKLEVESERDALKDEKLQVESERDAVTDEKVALAGKLEQANQTITTH